MKISERIVLKISLQYLEHLTSAAPAQSDAAAPVTIIVNHNSPLPSGAQDILHLHKNEMVQKLKMVTLQYPTSHLTPPLLHGLSPTLSETTGQDAIPGCSLSHFWSIAVVSSGSGHVSQLF